MQLALLLLLRAGMAETPPLGAKRASCTLAGWRVVLRVMWGWTTVGSGAEPGYIAFTQTKDGSLDYRVPYTLTR